MHVGFTIVDRGDRVEIQIYQPDPTASSPLVCWHEANDVIAVLVGRLYYRDDLRGRLGAANPAPSANDAELAAEAFRKSGASAVERLHGDFAVAIVDRGTRRLIASRDPMGGFPIFWLQQGTTIAVATALRPLVELLPRLEINRETLAELQMLPYAEIDYYAEAVFQGIHRLVPGSLLTADLQTATVSIRRYWNWLDQITDPGDVPLDSMAEQYAELLRRSVRERLRDNVASHLSGGMDCTSVALLAAEFLAGDGKQLHALSLIYEKLDELARETPFLEVALERPGIVPHRINGDDILDYDLFRDTPLHDEPYTGLFRAGTDIAMLRVAQQARCGTVFSGLGADELLADAPFYIADLIRRGRWLRAWSEARNWSRACNCSIWRFLGPFGLSPLMPAWWHAGWKPLLRGGFADWRRQNQHTIAPWIRPEFAKAGRLWQRALDNARRNFRSAKSTVQSEALARIQFTSGDWVRTELAAPLGILMAHPFRDHKVLAFGLGARRRIRPAPGEQKPLLAAAMRDVLPENIRKRRGKGHFNSVFYAGISRNLPHLEAMVRDSTIDDLGLFDKGELLRCMNHAALGVGEMHGVCGLNNSLAIIKWHSQLPAWLARKPAAARVIAADPAGGRLLAGTG